MVMTCRDTPALSRWSEYGRRAVFAHILQAPEPKAALAAFASHLSPGATMPKPDKQLSSNKPKAALGAYILIAFVVALLVVFFATRKHDSGAATAIEQTK
jgi:hypothetical protein